MSPLEVGHRLARSVRARAERSLPAAHVPAPDLAVQPRPWLFVPAVDPAPYLAAAGRIAAGRLDVFALRGVEVGAPPAWNRDPKTGIEAPLAFGKTLDYRDPDLVGDIKYLWEPNRHLHLVTLAQ
ncbi:MAG TPA: heparinase, partial [Burkholderiales bacterium]|nr:heparinase [Burkholderiales bacterium]